MARTKSTPTKPAPALVRLELDVANLLVAPDGGVDHLRTLGDRIAFYEGRIDAMAAELTAPTSRKVSGTQAEIDEYAERHRHLQERCRSARVVLTELRLLRTALQREMTVAPGANPAQM